MSKLKVSVVSTLVVAAVAAPFIIQYHHFTVLREENQALQEQARQAEALRAENEKLSAQLSQAEKISEAQLSELMRLRGQAASMRAKETEWANVQAENRQLKSQAQKEPNAKPPITVLADTPRVPASAWANVGMATPTAALQTLNWAISHRDTNVLASALMWADEQTRLTANATFAAAPEAVRARYGSLEGLLYSFYMEKANATDYRIIKQVDRGDQSVVAVEKNLATGGSQTERVSFQLDAGSYKQVIVPGVVDKMIQGELATPAKGRP